MATLTLKKGSAAGTPVDISCGFVDLDTLTAGTDYVLESEGEITLGIGGTLYTANCYLQGNGLEALNLEAASDLIDSPRWIHDSATTPDRYFPRGTYTQVPLGEQPDDWELHWRDKYYTQVTRTQSGHEIITYMPLTGDTFNPEMQYYANTDAAALFFTPNNGFFGVRTFYTSTSSNKTAVVCAGCYSSYGYTSALNNTAISAHLKGIDGTAVNIKSDGVQHYWRPYRTESNTVTTTGTARLRSVLLEVHLNGKTYIALAVVGFSVDESINYCGMWIAGNRFWISDDVQPGTPGNWGKKSGALTPSGATYPVFQNSDIEINFPASLNSCQFGGAAGGLHTWALTDDQYGAVCDFIWNESFIDRMTHLGKSPGDGIIGVYAMPDGFTIPSNTTMLQLYGIPTYTCSGYLVAKRTYMVDCGTVTIDPYTGYFSDYQAHIEIYLPFCGTYTLDPLKVIRSTLHLMYRFDIMSGACTAMLSASTGYPDGVNYPTGSAVILTAQGNAAFALPYAYSDGGVQAKLSAISGAIAAGMGAASGNPAGMLAGGMQIAQGLASAPQMSHSAATGNSGVMANRTPTVWITYPDMLYPDGYEMIVGRMGCTGGTVEIPVEENIGQEKSRKGLQVFDSVDLQNIDCTQAEADEIEALLKGGVFL